MMTVFDLDERYIALVVPDAYPKVRQPVLKNWSDEDLADFCGGVYFTISSKENA